jgi:AcrR family transcriptional regulator
MPRRKSNKTGERSYRGRSMAELRAERRERLLNAAFNLIGSQGYPKVAIERVCATARVATRHYYEHFQGREPLLHAVFERIEGEMSEVVIKSLAMPAEDNMERTDNALGALVHYMLSDPKRARVICLESVGVSAEMERRRRALIRKFSEFIAQTAHDLAEGGVLPQANYRMPAIALVGATNELMVEWLSGDTGLTTDQMERQVIAIFRTLIRGGAASDKESKKIEARAGKVTTKATAVAKAPAKPAAKKAAAKKAASKKPAAKKAASKRGS